MRRVVGVWWRLHEHAIAATVVIYEKNRDVYFGDRGAMVVAHSDAGSSVVLVDAADAEDDSARTRP